MIFKGAVVNRVRESDMTPTRSSYSRD